MLVPDPATAVGERVKLLDFGIAKLFDVSLRHAGMAAVEARTRTGAILGTPAYMAPEQCMSAAQIDGQADVYSVGVIAYQMVTGRLPHDDEHPFTLMAKKLAEPALPMGPLGEDLPADFPLFVATMIETKPADRPRIEQVEDTLARMLGMNASRRSGFLGRAANPEQNAAAAIPMAATKGPTREADKNADADRQEEPNTAPTVDAPSGERAPRSFPSPPWLAEGAADVGGVQAITLGSGRPTLRLVADDAVAAEPATASVLLPMAGAVPLAGRSRSMARVGVFSGLLLACGALVLLVSWRAGHPLPKAKPLELAAAASRPPELPKELPPERPPAAPEPSGVLTPEIPEHPDSGPPAAGHGKQPVTHGNRHSESTLRSPRSGEGPGRVFLIEGATVPDQEAAIRMCARANLNPLRKLNEKSVIRLQRSGTLQVISAPPAVLKSNLDECLRQMLQNIPAKSLPEEVTIRITR